MTIRRRLALSFIAILVLMAVNEGIYFWSSGLRTSTLDALGRALTRQVIIGAVRQDLDNLHKEVTLLSQLEEGTSTDADTRRVFDAKLTKVGDSVKRLQALSDPQDAEQIGDLDRTYAQLGDAWKNFYQYFGVAQGLALAQLVRADPLSQRLLIDTLPRLQEGQQTRVREAEANSTRVAALTDRLSLGIFLLSTLVAVVVAFLVSRHLTRGLSELKEGAAVIGGMTLDHRIPIRGNDEMAILGRAFNDMGDKLLTARSEITLANEELAGRNAELDKQRQVSESLLLNILPSQIAAELQGQGKVEPRYYEDVTILFTDFVGFTLSTEKLAAEDLVRLLHDYFTAFDHINARYGLEKLKTIGDSYLTVGGMPVRTPSHPVDAVMAAFEMVQAVVDRSRAAGGVPWKVRVGIHTGPVVAGVVGIQKFAFDVWGETVNHASRMESAGSANQINLSAATYLRIKDFFECEHRGKVVTKDQREVDMYFVHGLQPALLADDSHMPPPAFARRYRTYFQKDPPAFPAFLVQPSAVAEAPPVAQPSRD